MLNFSQIYFFGLWRNSPSSKPIFFPWITLFLFLLSLPLCDHGLVLSVLNLECNSDAVLVVLENLSTKACFLLPRALKARKFKISWKRSMPNMFQISLRKDCSNMVQFATKWTSLPSLTSFLFYVKNKNHISNAKSPGFENWCPRHWILKTRFPIFKTTNFQVESTCFQK